MKPRILIIALGFAVMACTQVEKEPAMIPVQPTAQGSAAATQEASLSEPVAVFAAKGNIPHGAVRIPALLTTKKGTVLAVAEGRDHAGDQAGNDLLLARSTDAGRTWTRPVVVRDVGAAALNNPCLVEDVAVGLVHLFFQLYPAGAREFSALQAGSDGAVRIQVICSDDEGLSWSEPRDLNAELKPVDALTAASGPGIGIQIQQGPARGRLVVPFNSQSAGKHFVNWMALSDDGGKTWRRGNVVPCEHSELNEVQVAETEAGQLLLNARFWRGAQRGRLVARSEDGGVSWSAATVDPVLPEPVCQGSLLAADSASGRRIFFLNPEGEPRNKGRQRGVLRTSVDEGRTWPHARVLVPGPFAYSSMSVLPDGALGVLYEPAGAERILFLRLRNP